MKILSIIAVFSVILSIFAFSPPPVSAHTYPDGTLLRLEGSFKIYTTFHNMRRWIKNAAVFNSYNYKWEDILVIPPIYIEDMPMNNLVREEGKIKVYAINDNGYKRHISNPRVFRSYGFSWRDIATISKEEMKNYPDSYLIREANNPRVFYLKNNKKHWIDSIESFYIHNLNWDAIHVINTTDISYYTLGETVTPTSTIQPPSGTIPAVPTQQPAIPAQPATSTFPEIPIDTTTTTTPTATTTVPIVPIDTATSTDSTDTTNEAVPAATPSTTPSATPSTTPSATPSSTPTSTSTSTPSTSDTTATTTATSTEQTGDTTSPIISNIQVTNITETSATITWTTDESSDSKIYYPTGPIPTFVYNITSATTTTSHSLSITGLTAATTYYYKVTSTDSSGNIATSAEGSFTTSTPPPSTGPEVRVTTSGSGPYPKIDGNIIVWSGNIYDISTGVQTSISSIKSTPSVSGNRIVYAYYSGGSASIKVYDLTTNTEQTIGENLSLFGDPDIDGDKVVYGTASGVVYLYDLATNTRTQLATSSYRPYISGDTIVWEHQTDYVIYHHKISTNTTRSISSTGRVYPKISDEIVIFHFSKIGECGITFLSSPEKSTVKSPSSAE